MAVDGSTLDVPDEKDNAKYFGYPSSTRGDTAFPQIRVLSLVECGTHLTIGSELSPYKISEQKLASLLFPKKLLPNMLLMADRNFYGYKLWHLCMDKANLLWRVKGNLILAREKKFPDGSFLSTVFDSQDRKNKNGITVRVIEYELKEKKSKVALAKPKTIYRLITNILDYKKAPAAELAALYHERWEIESVFGEMKGSLYKYSTILRSKTPDLIKQEVWGLIMAHYSIRQLVARAAWGQDIDPDKLSFMNAVRVIKRKMPQVAVFPPEEVEAVEE
jgi:hypothetical protein